MECSKKIGPLNHVVEFFDHVNHVMVHRNLLFEFNIRFLSLDSSVGDSSFKRMWPFIIWFSEFLINVGYNFADFVF